MNTFQLNSSKFVHGLPAILPSSSVPDYVSLRVYRRLAILIFVNNATTVTGSAITIKQATDVAGTGEKPVTFETVYQNLDTDASDALSEVAVVADTFTTLTTNDKNAMYIVELNTSDLDYANDFNCVRAGVGDATATVISVVYVLSGPRFTGSPESLPSGIVN